LQLRRLNVLVAGSGGIASALIERLLHDYPVQRLFCLQRAPRPVSTDPRVVCLPVDAETPDMLAAAAHSISLYCDELHLVINTVGLLHAEQLGPEKRLKEVRGDHLDRLMSINAFFVAHLAQAVAPLLKHTQPAMLASLSARVGSITDNQLGGWYGYRASKAAHNMLLRTLACEWRISHKNTCILALHPGTVKTRLSDPFVSPSYKNRVLLPHESAAALLEVMGSATARDSASFLDWQGKTIPW
jgi:NAD(P)-dependent dehydrogenase (short-subunit alcohol dehydrogenase family)